jgi:predicted amidohydrolase YtcJ
VRPDLVLWGGRVWAGRGLPQVEALACSEGRIQATGRSADLLPLAGPATRVVPLLGRAVVPGFNDAHVHLMDAGLSLLSVDLRGAHDEEACMERVGEYARTLPAEDWILNGQWDHEAWPSKGLPSRHLLDKVTPRNPAFLTRLDGHMALANTAALAAAGITTETKDPPGGTIVRGADSRPTGILKDNAMDLLTRVIPPPDGDRRLRAARAAFGEAARLGVTTIQDNSPASALPTYLELRDRGELTSRLSVWRYAHTFPALREAGVRTGLGDDWIRLGPLKILADGSLGAATAALFEPYLCEPFDRGLLLHGEEDLKRLVAEADRAGFDLAVHAIGDRANHLVLEAFEDMVGRNPSRPRRLRVEHAQMVRKQDIGRFKALGAIASVQPSHLIDDMRFALQRLGPERVLDLYHIAAFADAGVALAFGTDWPVEPLDPRIGLYAAVTREFLGGGPEGGFVPQEKIGLEEALHHYTWGSAYAEGTQDRKGTLVPGSLADLVVFHEDPFAHPVSDLLRNPVDLTVVGGRVVFER